ncbi:PREDICTED: pentatricopeptide repeat-containing protein At2g36730 [Nelumbo nucifera]|uniref:Pentatricopeptide repeat-containing protein At2g36730 n=2 Tax=Nelumbo nucifera TaxID=4432 RepID=A0A822YTL1_NELNU|nr:PREDICTED: pentatricopeptide repeat-containing protein At2g36730 [Nelumbo nucifera]DAD34881.1 TPA_asm: hypothetical protein HUJ06_005521 [Nelumbo nucifera]
MHRFARPTVCLCYPPKNSNGNLNFVSRKEQFLSLLKDCSSIKVLNQIHAQIQTYGLGRDGYVMSHVLRFCALSSPSGDLEYARSVLYHALDRITSSWNIVIRGYALNDLPREAIAVFLEMRSRGVKPNKLTFPFLLKACAHLSALQEGRQIQADAVKHGVDSDIYVQNTLIHLYGSCGEISDARRVFDTMFFRTLVSWNAIITAYVGKSLLDDSVRLFTEMIFCGYEPDEASMVVLISACSELGNLSLGRWAHCQVIEKGLVINCRLGTALVDMYAKCGAVGCARMIFDRMRERNVWTWSAMILGLAQHGLAREALDLFLEMKNCSVQPNHVTFLGVLCACSHAGLVDEGYQFFHDMTHVHGIKPRMTHYGAMVDILSRAGRLKEAYKFIFDMPTEPDPVVWRTLLSACSIHDADGNSGIREKVRNKLLHLEPTRSGNLVMVANMYAEVGLWEEAANMRRVMREEGQKKMAGESCIEIGGHSHRFFSGDDSLVDCEIIYNFLDGLNLNMMAINHE